MIALLATLLAQTPVIPQDPFTSQKARVVTTSGGALQVSCVGGTCTGGGAGGASTQGPSNDGGYAWHVDLERVGGVAVSTGTGTGGAGIPRVTVSSDSSLTCNAGSNLNTSSLALDATLTGRTQKAQVTDGTRDGTVKAASTAAIATDTALVVAVSPNNSVAVTGTVTTTPPSNASTNVAQFGGTNVSTGAGVGGAGIPRVTVSSDSSLAANQSVNVAQVNGVATSTGVGASGTGTQRNACLVHDGTTVAGVIAGTTALKVDLSSVAGTATVTAAAGVAKVGIVGNANAAIDAANNAAAPANVIADGFEAATQGTTQPTAATAGNVRRGLIGTDGVLYVRPHGPVSWSCFVQAATVLTQCRAAPAAGLRAYVTTVTCDNQAATVQGVDVAFGTGTNCATGTTALTHKFQMGTNATTTSPDHVAAYFSTPLVPTAANAICVRPTAATAFGCTLTGYDAP